MGEIFGVKLEVVIAYLNIAAGGWLLFFAFSNRLKPLKAFNEIPPEFSWLLLAVRQLGEVASFGLAGLCFGMAAFLLR